MADCAKPSAATATIAIIYFRIGYSSSKPEIADLTRFPDSNRSLPGSGPGRAPDRGPGLENALPVTPSSPAQHRKKPFEALCVPVSRMTKLREFSAVAALRGIYPIPGYPHRRFPLPDGSRVSLLISITPGTAPRNSRTEELDWNAE